jgi:RecA/RadA recombinase
MHLVVSRRYTLVVVDSAMALYRTEFIGRGCVCIL